jgi:hypothetical protein
VNIISEEKLHPLTLRIKFYRALLCAVENLNLVGSVFLTLSINAASVKLQICINTLACSHGDIDVDLVLALQPPDSFWPECSKDWKEKPQSQGLPAEVIQEIITTGVYLVPRYEDESQKQDKESQPIQWRVSFSVAESIILRRFTEVQRSAFRIMKVILENQTNHRIFGKKSGNLENNFVNKLTTTYIIISKQYYFD